MGSSTSETGGGPGEAPAAGDLIGVLVQGRRQFLSLVDHVRPELHRYCTRMTGSAADGEDVVQETLARAYYELSQLKEMPALRPWLFRIAHNRAIDHWRHETHRAGEPLEAAAEIAGAAALEPDNALARRQAVQAALGCFLALAPAQRGCVILKDVLDHSLEEIAAELELSVPAVKAALHRGRAALQALTEAPPAAAIRPRETSAALRRYASLFNAHDWEGVRSLLADDVRLDLVSRRKAAGRREVGMYFSNYGRSAGWHLVPAWFEGREVLAVLADPKAPAPLYFVELGWRGGEVVAIRDFRYVAYIAQEGSFELDSA
jgi:RNA polymerase sigma-70 factor (ECF subfamily)